MTREQRLVDREVKSQDPDLSPQANRILTEEARAAVGSDHARVPAGRGRADAGAQRGTFGAAVSSNRPFVLISFMVLVAAGAVVWLATGKWWALLIALAVHFVTTIVVVGGILKMTTDTEHVSPEAAARLEDEGVTNPDGRLTELVEEFKPEEREQQSEWTPSRDSRPR
jgi:hypothetical protein